MLNQIQISNSDSSILAIVYKPPELLGIIASYFSQQDVSKQGVFLQGIYWKNPKDIPAWAYRYDVLLDECMQSEFTLHIPHHLAEDIKDNSLVTVGGMLGHKMQNDGELQKSLTVLTAQNTQAAKSLNVAKDHARNLEQQLSVLTFRGISTNMETRIAACIFTAIVTIIVCL